MPSSRPNSVPLLRTLSSRAPESIRERTRRRTLGLCALALALAGSVSGCAWRGDAPSGPDAAARVSRLANFPEAGVEACLIPGEGYSPSLDLAVRGALDDRGFRVRLLDRGASPEAHRCRTTVTISAVSSKGFSELPERLTLDFRDAVTGEAKRAAWKCDAADAGNALTPGPFGDPERIVRDLVDQLFPRPVTLRKD